MISNNTNKWYTDLITLSCILYIVPIYLYFIRGVYYLFICALFNTYSSFMYHYHYEQHIGWLYTDMMFTIISFNVLLFDIIMYSEYQYLALVIVSFIFYYYGSGRKESYKRSDNYELFHLGWHLLIFILTTIHSYYHSDVLILFLL
jgi:hypothetical protein